MKKLLFSVSVIAALVGCKESQKTEASEKHTTTKIEKEVTPAESSEPNEMKEMPPVEKSAESKATLTKEEEMGEGKMEEPKHGSPDQNKIDSIKAAKQKGKK